MRSTNFELTSTNQKYGQCQHGGGGGKKAAVRAFRIGAACSRTFRESMGGRCRLRTSLQVRDPDAALCFAECAAATADRRPVIFTGVAMGACTQVAQPAATAAYSRFR